jgi:NADH-quinone oxidoreductase subunit M
MFLLSLIFLPLVVGILLAGFGNVNTPSQRIAQVVSIIVFIATFGLFCNSGLDKSIQLNWIPALNIHFSLAADGLSKLMILLTTLLVPFIIATGNTQNKNNHVLYGLILMMQTGLLGVFTASDGFLFYVFWELALIPIYFIAAFWSRDENRINITLKFFIYTIFGSLFMLVAIIYLGLKANSFSIEAIYAYGRALPAADQSWLFWCLFIAFAIKMPIFPFHTWQPNTYVASSTQGTMLLSGIMLKMGIYGCMRWLLPVVPIGAKEWQGLVIVLCVIGIVYTSLIALVQTDIKRMTAYSSIAHVGLIAAGIFVGTPEGMMGASLQMFAHGINVVALFYIISLIARKTNTRTMADLGGIAHIAPKFATLFMIIMLGTIALPLTNGFVGEFLLLSAVFSYSGIAMAFAGLTIIFGAIYMINAYRAVMYGELTEASSKFADLSTSEFLVLAPLAAMVIVFGIFPAPIIKLVEPALMALQAL